MLIENGRLLIDGFAITLPVITGVTKVQVWRVPAEYRESGFFVAVDKEGVPREIPACSPVDAEFIGELEYIADESQKVEAAKSAKLERIKLDCEGALAALASTYPAGELQSWPQQVREAEAILSNTESPAPLLSAIAEARGVPLAELASRVQEKAALYAEFSGVIIGKRQALEDRLVAAVTAVEVEDIAW